MLSMINPDSMTRFDSQNKFSTSNIHKGGFDDDQHDGAEGHSPHKKGGKSSMLNFPPQTKTMTNFYPGPLGSVDERAGLSTAAGTRPQRPTSAKLKKNAIPVSPTTIFSSFFYRKTLPLRISV
jgi:hypothetical protein